MCVIQNIIGRILIIVYKYKQYKPNKHAIVLPFIIILSSVLLTYSRHEISKHTIISDSYVNYLIS